MPSQGELREHRLTVESDLEPPAVGRDELDRLQPRLEGLQEIGRQTGGPLSVVSNGAVFDADPDHRFRSLLGLERSISWAHAKAKMWSGSASGEAVPFLRRLGHPFA